MRLDNPVGTAATAAHAPNVRLTRMGAGSYGTLFSGAAGVALKITSNCSTYVPHPEDGAHDVLVPARVIGDEVAGSTVVELSALRRMRGVTAVVAFKDVQCVRLETQPEGACWTAFSMPLAVEDLRRVIARGAMRPWRVREVMLSLLQAVAACHERRLLHLDIKPGNILCYPEGDAKLADFGIARYALAGGDVHAVRLSLTEEVQTLWYRAPELLSGGKEFSAAVDVWSTGVVMLDMLFGKEVMVGKNPEECVAHLSKLLGYRMIDGAAAALPAERAAGLARLLKLHRLEPACVDLLAGLCDPAPLTRLTASAALRHPYFTEGMAAPPPHEIETVVKYADVSAVMRRHPWLTARTWGILVAWLLDLSDEAGVRGAVGHAVDVLLCFMQTCATPLTTGNFQAYAAVSLCLVCKALSLNTNLGVQYFCDACDGAFSYRLVCEYEMEVLRTLDCQLILGPTVLDLDLDDERATAEATAAATATAEATPAAEATAPAPAAEATAATAATAAVPAATAATAAVPAPAARVLKTFLAMVATTSILFSRSTPPHELMRLVTDVASARQHTETADALVFAALALEVESVEFKAAQELLRNAQKKRKRCGV